MAFVSDQVSYQMDPLSHPDEWLDFDSFLDFPSGQVDDQLASADSISPADLSMPYEADATFGHSPAEFMQPSIPEMPSFGFSQTDFLTDLPTDAGLFQNTDPLFDDGTFSGHVYPYDGAAFRHLVEMEAAADPRMASIKEKRREASIALHLQRLCDATALDLEMSSDSSTSFSSPCWSEFMRDSVSPQPTKTSSENTPTPTSAPGVGGVELVLDLNMNATTNLPKKQKPRSQAQKENYIKARKYGACEKHKKQHKRCNCLEKAAARAGVNESPIDVAFKERPRQPTLQVIFSPTAQQPTSTGHDPSSAPMVLQPTRAIKRSPNSSRGHDPSCGPSTGLPSAKSSNRVSSSPGHDSSHRKTLAIQSVKTAKSTTAGRPGHDPTCHFRAGPQSVNAAHSITGEAPHLALGVSNTTVILRPPEGSCYLMESSKTATQPFVAARGMRRLEIRRPQSTQPTIPAGQFGVASTATSNESTHGHVGSLGLRHIQVYVSCSGILPENGDSKTVFQNPKQPLEAAFARSQLSPKNQPGISWSGGNLVHLQDFKQFGAVLSGTVFSIARAWQSLASPAAWAEDVICKCVSVSGRLLMTARKGLHLSSWRIY